MLLKHLVHTYTDTYAHTSRYTHQQAHVHSHTSTLREASARTRAHTHTHTHTHTQVSNSSKKYDVGRKLFVYDVNKNVTLKFWKSLEILFFKYL